MDLRELSLETSLGEAPRHVLVDTDTGHVILRHHDDGSGHNVEAHIFDGRLLKLESADSARPIGQVTAQLTSLRPVRAFELPDGEVAARTNAQRVLLWTIPVVIAVVLFIAGMILDNPIVQFPLFLGAAFAAMLVKAISDSGRGYKKWSYAVGREKTPIGEIELPPAREQIHVNEVKEEYGKLLSDIVYRIECPALFDPHEPVTKEFTLALLQWDNNDAVLDEDGRRELAIKVRSTFAAAKANAERIGMTHIPEPIRDRAGTALKAAKLAADKSATQPERDAALKQAVEILDSLALYYLPSGAQARKAITGNALLQLPGRRS